MSVTQHYIVTIKIPVVIFRYWTFCYHRAIARIDVGIFYSRSKWKQVLEEYEKSENWKTFENLILFGGINYHFNFSRCAYEFHQRYLAKIIHQIVVILGDVIENGCKLMSIPNHLLG